MVEPMATDGNSRPGRRRRSDGEMSRQRILDAAAEIAAERGYDGTSIAAVSAKCGLPASSIYWHFKDKDELIVAVIERSFESWLSTWQIPDSGDTAERAAVFATRIAKAMLDSPDFIRLGLMLVLERRPVELRARAAFLHVRDQTYGQLMDAIRELAPELTDVDLRHVTTYALAGADGLFIAKELGGDAVDLIDLFSTHAYAVYATVQRLSVESNFNS